MISGHGYQRKDVAGDEIDGMDECIRTKNEIILDDDLWKLFIKDMDKTLEDNDTVLAHRLCGAGGGGYFLVFVNHLSIFHDKNS